MKIKLSQLFFTKLLAVLLVSQVVFGFGVMNVNAQFGVMQSDQNTTPVQPAQTNELVPESVNNAPQKPPTVSTEGLIALIIPLPVCNQELLTAKEIICDARGRTIAVQDVTTMVSLYAQMAILAGITIAAFTSILFGFQTLLSATNFVQAKSIKTKLKNSASALILLLFSYVILSAVDPRFTTFQLKKIENVAAISCCQVQNGETYYWMTPTKNAEGVNVYACEGKDQIVEDKLCSESQEGDVELGSSNIPGTVSPNVVGDKAQLIQTILNSPITFQVVAKKESLEKMNLNALKSIIQSHLILPGKIRLNALAEPSESHKTGPHADGRGVDIDSPSLTQAEIELLFNGMKNSSTITQFLYCQPYDRGNITCTSQVKGTNKCSTGFAKTNWVGGINEERRAVLCNHRTHIHYTATGE